MNDAPTSRPAPATCLAPDGKHGTAWMRRVYGCRCPATAQDLYRQGKRTRTRILLPARASTWNAVATARRLQAAAVYGYSSYALAPLLGVNPQRVRHLQNMRYTTVTDELAERVANLVERLHRQPPPANEPGRVGGGGVTRTRREAARHGWAPLGAWMPDEIGDPDAKSDLAYQRDHTAGPAIDWDEVTWLRDTYGLQTLDKIAAELGVNRESLTRAQQRANAVKAGFVNTRYPDDVLVDAVRRVLAGESRQAVAADTGISKKHLNNIVAGRFRPELLAQAQRLFPGETPEGLAERDRRVVAARRAVAVRAARIRNRANRWPRHEVAS
jgi:hypothetical protein